MGAHTRAGQADVRDVPQAVGVRSGRVGVGDVLAIPSDWDDVRC